MFKSDFENHPILKIHKFIFLVEKSVEYELQKELGLGFSQFMILVMVGKHPGISQRKLSLLRDVTQAAISRHIEVMKKKGYISQKQNENNRREHILHLTLKGEQYANKAFVLAEKKIRVIFETVNIKEEKYLGKIFDQLLQCFKSEMPEYLLCEKNK